MAIPMSGACDRELADAGACMAAAQSLGVDAGDPSTTTTPTKRTRVRDLAKMWSPRSPQERSPRAGGQPQSRGFIRALEEASTAQTASPASSQADPDAAAFAAIFEKGSLALDETVSAARQKAQATSRRTEGDAWHRWHEDAAGANPTDDLNASIVTVETAASPTCEDVAWLAPTITNTPGSVSNASRTAVHYSIHSFCSDGDGSNLACEGTPGSLPAKCFLIHTDSDGDIDDGRDGHHGVAWGQQHEPRALEGEAFTSASSATPLPRGVADAQRSIHDVLPSGSRACWMADRCSSCGKRQGYFLGFRGLGIRQRGHERRCSARKARRIGGAPLGRAGATAPLRPTFAAPRLPALDELSASYCQQAEARSEEVTCEGQDPLDPERLRRDCDASLEGGIVHERLQDATEAVLSEEQTLEAMRRESRARARAVFYDVSNNGSVRSTWSPRETAVSEAEGLGVGRGEHTEARTYSPHWSSDLTHMLGCVDSYLPDEELLLDTNEHASVSEAIRHLSNGVISPVTGYCIVLSRSQSAYFLVYRSDKMEEAFDCFNFTVFEEHVEPQH